MNKVSIAFSNGETLELCEGQIIMPISKLIVEDDISVSQGTSYELWNHCSAGMVPSICELLCKCDFFHLIDDEDTVYNSSAVVSIKNL
ncbi:hypothetical protein SAMN05444401_3582 [Clostridium amylolyticum]|uniref:Uncharacterized protein n=1 Tax=Clostridium amylolyticum TaxID=1121298 RepID=A0A1M6L2F9_9CLOT|nr:hypothetical protein [Clostridium amylolyticum]SHJ65343.1 hypothetical protein SAMN05444401_3582 [Clostridium amylolyticum]